MTDTYLAITAPPVLVPAALGSVVICSIAPDVGQYWKPTFLHVSNQSGIACTADLYVGSYKSTIAVPPRTYLKDSTVRGDNDTTSIISGTIIHPAEAVTVVFTGAPAGDLCSFQLYGISSDVPPPLGQLPDVPGTRFSFTQTIISAQPIAQFVSTQGSSLVIPALQSKILTPNPAAYTGNMENLYVFTNFTGGVGGGMRLQLSWGPTPQSTVQGQQTAIDFVDSRFDGTVMNQTIPVKGPWLTVTAVNETGVQITVDVVIADAGAVPQYSNGGVHFTPPGGTDASQLVSLNTQQVIAANSTFSSGGVGPAPGRAKFWCGCVATGITWFADIVATDAFGSTSEVYHLDQTSEPWQVHDIFLPALPVTLSVHNSNAAPQTFMFELARSPFYEYTG